MPRVYEYFATYLAEDLSAQNIYVQSVRLNGKHWDQPFLPYRELKNGGALVFQMGPKPNAQWGTQCALPG